MPDKKTLFNSGEQIILDRYKIVMNEVKKEFPPLRQEPIIADQANVYNNEGAGNSNSNARVRVLQGPNSHPVTPQKEENYDQFNNIFNSLRVPEEPENYINNNSAFSYVLVIFLSLILIFLITILILGLSGIIH